MIKMEWIGVFEPVDILLTRCKARFNLEGMERFILDAYRRTPTVYWCAFSLCECDMCVIASRAKRFLVSV